eukprot:6039699-Alexandrium_andersonii.AAC.1
MNTSNGAHVRARRPLAHLSRTQPRVRRHVSEGNTGNRRNQFAVVSCAERADAHRTLRRRR